MGNEITVYEGKQDEEEFSVCLRSVWEQLGKPYGDSNYSKWLKKWFLEKDFSFRTKVLNESSRSDGRGGKSKKDHYITPVTAAYVQVAWNEELQKGLVDFSVAVKKKSEVMSNQLKETKEIVKLLGQQNQLLKINNEKLDKLSSIISDVQSTQKFLLPYNYDENLSTPFVHALLWERSQQHKVGIAAAYNLVYNHLTNRTGIKFSAKGKEKTIQVVKNNNKLNEMLNIINELFPAMSIKSQITNLVESLDKLELNPRAKAILKDKFEQINKVITKTVN